MSPRILAKNVLLQMTVLVLASFLVGALLVEELEDTVYHGKFSNLTVVHFIGNSGRTGRYPIIYTVIAFLGIQEAGESSTEAGIRELKEETGYAATDVLFSSSGRQGTMPSRLNDTARHVVADVDGDAQVNSHPKQFLDDAEMTKVVLIKASDLLKTIQSLEKELDIASNVYTFALGYAMRNL
ncbi:hypothetical protein NECAME_00016 [Necator americanus]|uniref:Uncharacterized protein n=1 Tax=Necator americanus TaxID=51031 RepID=W2U1F1_NECAM|nr:hypothetical protein NECAME_00016 [Necator americanus]ETN87157.1 hypothetical protein NECAME_00016 [Necator americanus]